MTVCANPKPTSGANSTATLNITPGVQMNGSSGAAMTVTCRCGQPGCRDTKAAA